ncbi:hypothetical protein BC938DRAFT_472313 [Jimgerdemannia flammicorona]|uniref:Uncharacterized protein n=1 Tax=Jimgerdemannia flammicorona TaxID=994334 RepID=A0A433QU40_9FUNG|nr:hypothetical protein BC938DRAFT_472313 [Jimgerdemannia flammicorona]
MPLWLPEDTINAQYLDIKLFLVENLETGLGVVAQLFSIDGNVILRQPVGEEDGAHQRLSLVESREVLQRHSIDVLVRPFPILLGDQTILEQAKSFVSPNTYKTFDGQDLQRLDSLVYTADPTRQFTRTVDIVGLDVRRKVLLRHEIEVDHGGSQSIGITAEVRNDLEHGARECAVDLRERNLSGWGVTKETVGHGDSARIGGRVAGTNELNALKLDPRLVGCSPIATVFDKLPDEGDDALRAVLVDRGQIDFVAEYHQPSSDKRRR